MLLNRTIRKGDADGLVLLGIIFVFFGLPLVVCGVKAYQDEQIKAEVAKAEAEAKIALEEKNRLAAQEQAARRTTIGGVVKVIEFSQPRASEWTRLVFEDGREKSFGGLPNVPVKVGDNVTVVFDGTNRIVSVEINK